MWRVWRGNSENHLPNPFTWIVYKVIGEGTVFNTYSNRTVMMFDIVRQLPPFAAAKINAHSQNNLITQNSF